MIVLEDTLVKHKRNQPLGMRCMVSLTRTQIAPNPVCNIGLTNLTFGVFVRYID